MRDHSDQEWEAIGKVDAYYGVLTYEQYSRFQNDRLDLNAFFETGEAHLERIFEIIHQHLVPDFHPQRGLDFGCGVGRILIPLSRKCKQLVGADVADSMLVEAAKNCNTRGLTNVTFVKSDDQLSQISGTFDFIHSYIVFQHIPAGRGEAIFEKLINHLSPGGVGAIHLVYLREISKARRMFQWLRQHISLFNGFVNILYLKRPFDYPALQMHEYRMSNILRILEQQGCQQIYMDLLKHASPYTVAYGTMLFFMKRAPDSA